jgi:hypothetical protein
VSADAEHEFDAGVARTLMAVITMNPVHFEESKKTNF